MREIGGYLELEANHGEMLHESAIKLNTGRNALAYLIEAYDIKKLAMPKFMCDSCDAILNQYGVGKRVYPIDENFVQKDITLEKDEWIYVVNFYGQVSKETIEALHMQHRRIILDQSHAYFETPVAGIPTLYTCRKYFGVPDGAVLYTEQTIGRAFERDVSYERMKHLLGRFEENASAFYQTYTDNEKQLIGMPIRYMSKLTENLLRGIDYDSVKNSRTENFAYLHKKLANVNKLHLSVPDGAFMYPLWIENGSELRKRLQTEKIYIPCLWPNVLDECTESELEYQLAKDILPLPVDQRYTTEDMEYIVSRIEVVRKEL